MNTNLTRRVEALLEVGRREPLVIVRLRALERILDRDWSARDVLDLVNLTIALDEIGAAQASEAILSRLCASLMLYTSAPDGERDEGGGAHPDEKYGEAAHHGRGRGTRGVRLESGQGLLP